MKPLILVVAEDAGLRATLARWLVAAGYRVELAESRKHAREVVAQERIVLALVAPARLEETGVDLARELGGKVEHVIVIAEPANNANPPPPMPEEGLIRQPLSEPEVLACVRAALGAEPATPEPAAPQLLRFGAYALDVGGRTCLDGSGNEMPLTRAEFSVLLAFTSRPGQVLSRDELSQAVTGRGTEPDDRSVDVLISRVRRKIEPDPKSPRIIVTVPGEGYKLSAKPQSPFPRAPAAPPPALDAVPEGKEAKLEETKVSPQKALSTGRFLTGLIAGAVALAGVAGLLIAFWHPGYATRTGSQPAQKFDANAVPLVLDEVRALLSTYEHEPEAKAIAISREGWGFSFGAADDESAKNEALQRCRDRNRPGVCRLYAVGNNVVWQKSTLPLPLPADVHADTSGMALTSNDLVKIWQMIWHVPPQKIVADYLKAENHRALAIGLNSAFQYEGRATPAEAVRLAIERCSDFAQSPCLVLSVDGLLTFPLPQSHRIAAPFTLAGEPEMTEADRERIGQIYGGTDWRALAKGQSGRWYAVGGHASESAAVEAALKTCRAAESDCELYAIGNFRVGEKLETKTGG